MSDPHFDRAPAPSSMGPTAAEAEEEEEEEEEEEREPGALAPRQLPGADLSATAGASGAFASSSVDFGFGNSWSHIPIPVGDDFDPHHHRHPPHHEGGRLHEPRSSVGASAGHGDFSGVAGPHSDDDEVMSYSHPGVSVVTHGKGGARPAAPSAGGGVVEATLRYAHDASSTNSLAEVEVGERLHAHGSSMSGGIGVDSPHGSALASEDGRATTPSEQVSLPDDIYGAARVSEYWHGVPGLSSLASTYVYDDIWAGDGGLNPREDIMTVTGWTAGGGHAATQDRRGGGEAVAEISSAGSHPGGQQSPAARSSPARHASVSSGGDERRAGTAGRCRMEDGNSGGGSSGGSSDGRDGGGKRPGRRHRLAGKSGTGGGHEDGSARDSSEEHSGRVSWDGGRSWGAGGGRAHSSGAADRRRCEEGEGHASKKRRTPSPDAGRRIPVAAGMASADSWGTDETSKEAAAVAAASREQQALREAEVIRWCQKVSSPRAVPATAAVAWSGGHGGLGGSGSSGDEERFFAGRVLDPAPRPPPRRRRDGLGDRDTTSASISNGGSGWGGEGSPPTPPEFVWQHNEDGRNGSDAGDGGFRGGLPRGSDQATAMAGESGTASRAGSSSFSSGRQSGAEIAATVATAAFSETPQASVAEATPPKGKAAGTGQGSPSPSDTREEAFFASHTLWPKREPSVGGGGGDWALSSTESLPPCSSGGDAAGGRRLIPRKEEVLATAAAAAAAKAAAAVSDAESSNSMDWQVRPEAMMGFFTTVGWASPSSMLRAGRRRAAGVRHRLPPPSNGVGAARRGKQFTVAGGEPNPRRPSSCESDGGDSPGTSGGGGGGGGDDGIDAAVAVAAERERAARMAQDAEVSGDPPAGVGGISKGWNGGGFAGGGASEGGGDDGGAEAGVDSSWGW